LFRICGSMVNWQSNRDSSAVSGTSKGTAITT